MVVNSFDSVVTVGQFDLIDTVALFDEFDSDSGWVVDWAVGPATTGCAVIRAPGIPVPDEDVMKLSSASPVSDSICGLSIAPPSRARKWS